MFPSAYPRARRATAGRLLVASLASFLIASAASGIGLGDLKKKAEEKAKEKIEKGVKPTATPTNADSTSAKPGGTPGNQGAASGGGQVAISKVSVKYDFVPGDKVILADDFSADELGEFPRRWRLITGNFDVSEFEGRKWLRLAGNEGQVQMKLDAALPERWTFECDMHATRGAGILTVNTGSAGQPDSWWIAFGPHGNDVASMCNKRESLSTLPTGDLGGHHHIALMADGHGLKVYVDRERVVNYPEIEWTQPPENLTFRFRYNEVEPIMTNVRLAEKSEPKKDLLADGPFVTHGILFESGSDVVRPESAPVLRQVTAYLAANASVRVLITGHTDDVGADEANLDLSQRRATAVKAVLSSEFAVDPARLETGGKGESEPIAKNDSLEARAMNRRVEFAKIG